MSLRIISQQEHKNESSQTAVLVIITIRVYLMWANEKKDRSCIYSYYLGFKKSPLLSVYEQYVKLETC